MQQFKGDGAEYVVMSYTGFSTVMFATKCAPFEASFLSARSFYFALSNGIAIFSGMSFSQDGYSINSSLL